MTARAYHIPMRTCVVCGLRKTKNSLLRLALSRGAECMVELDPGECQPGRGAYVCTGCLSELRFTKRVQKAFRGKARGVSLGERANGSETPTTQEKSNRYRVQSEDMR